MLGLDGELNTINTVTLPSVEALLDRRITQLKEDLTSLLDRLDGATITIHLAEKK